MSLTAQENLSPRFSAMGKIAEEVNKLLSVRRGLMCGICNGFQALIKLGLVPYGEIKRAKSRQSNPHI